MKPSVSELHKKMRLAHLEYLEAKKTAAWHRAALIISIAIDGALAFYLKSPLLLVIFLSLCAIGEFIRWAYQQGNNCSVSKLRLKYEAAKLEYDQAFEKYGMAEINEIIYGHGKDKK
nr:MAG TPA: hypothetical protein [Caudoviricetes sp.]